MSNETNDSNQSDAESSAPKELPAPPKFESDELPEVTRARNSNRVSCAILGCLLPLIVLLAIVGSIPSLARIVFHA